MGLAAGTRLGHYEILEPLGAGGMGEVFRAHDAKLDRDVEVFADVSGIRLLRTIALPWTGFAHDGSPLVIRDLSTRDLYALDWEAP